MRAFVHLFVYTWTVHTHVCIFFHVHEHNNLIYNWMQLEIKDCNACGTCMVCHSRKCKVKGTRRFTKQHIEAIVP